MAVKVQKIKCDEDSLKKKLSGLLKQVRESANLSQTELAEKLDTNQSGVSAVESGVALVNFVTIERWLEGCGKELHLVVTNKGETLESLGFKERA